MVSVRKTLPELADGSVDLAAWSDLLVAERPHLERDEILQTCLWLDDVAAESLPQGLELAEMVAQLRLDQASVLASICYHAWRKLLVNESDLIRRVGPEVGELTLNVGAMATSSLLQISAPKMMEKEHRKSLRRYNSATREEEIGPGTNQNNRRRAAIVKKKKKNEDE